MNPVEAKIEKNKKEDTLQEKAIYMNFVFHLLLIFIFSCFSSFESYLPVIFSYILMYILQFFMIFNQI